MNIMKESKRFNTSCLKRKSWYPQLEGQLFNFFWFKRTCFLERTNTSFVTNECSVWVNLVCLAYKHSVGAVAAGTLHMELMCSGQGCRMSIPVSSDRIHWKQYKCMHVCTVVCPLPSCSLDRHSVVFIYNEGDAFIAMEWLKNVIARYK